MIAIAYGSDAARTAAAQIRPRLGAAAPDAAIILGSGLGGLANQISDMVRIPFAEIPGFPSATVAGHAGALIAGTLEGRRVLALAGRFHMYEGHGAALAALDPKLTPVAPVNPVPVIVTESPPLALPRVGLTPVTVGVDADAS